VSQALISERTSSSIKAKSPRVADRGEATTLSVDVLIFGGT